MTAKLVDPKRRSSFKVMVLPNLYGDILTDEAAEFQGGVGTAGSANIGKKYAMFEAIHGSAPRMVKENRAQYADPCSMIRAGAMMMNHIGFPDKGRKLEMALEPLNLINESLAAPSCKSRAHPAEATKIRPRWLLSSAWSPSVRCAIRASTCAVRSSSF